MTTSENYFMEAGINRTESCSVQSTHAINEHRTENALDALLDELQTFSSPITHTNELLHVWNTLRNGRKGSIDSATTVQVTGSLRRLHSYPSDPDTTLSCAVVKLQSSENKINFLRTNKKLFAISKRIPPLPPPRTSSKSPTTSPTEPQITMCNSKMSDNNLLVQQTSNSLNMIKTFSQKYKRQKNEQVHRHSMNDFLPSKVNSYQSVNCQDEILPKNDRQVQLEQRHQELLRKQKVLQEQYARLQRLQRNTSECTSAAFKPPLDILKKTGSESNLSLKKNLKLSVTNSGSLINLSNTREINNTLARPVEIKSGVNNLENSTGTTPISMGVLLDSLAASNNLALPNKVYKTEIL